MAIQTLFSDTQILLIVLTNKQYYFLFKNANIPEKKINKTIEYVKWVDSLKYTVLKI